MKRMTDIAALIANETIRQLRQQQGIDAGKAASVPSKRRSKILKASGNADRCPRCKSRTLATERIEATYTRSQRMTITGDGSFVPTRIAEASGIDGADVWTRREVTRDVCDACQQEIQYGGRAHTTASKSAWQRKDGREEPIPRNVETCEHCTAAKIDHIMLPKIAARCARSQAAIAALVGERGN